MMKKAASSTGVVPNGSGGGPENIVISTDVIQNQRRNRDRASSNSSSPKSAHNSALITSSSQMPSLPPLPSNIQGSNAAANKLSIGAAGANKLKQGRQFLTPQANPGILEVSEEPSNNAASSTSNSSNSANAVWRSKFTTTLQEEYLQYYFPTYLKQWRFIAQVETAFAIAFGIYSFASNRGHNNEQLILSAVSLFACLLELMMPLYPAWYTRNTAFPIHLGTQLVYGCCLALRDLFSSNIDPAGYIYCFLAFLYTSVVPDVRPSLLVGSLVIGLNILSQFIKISSDASVCPENGHISCSWIISVNGLFMFMANIIGFIFSYVYYMDTRKQFYNLFNLWEEKRLLTEAGEKAEAIALSIIPKGVWEDFRKGEKIDLNGILSNPLYSYKNVSILFGDVVGFTTLSAAVSADTLVQLLNSVFLEFDIIVEMYGLEKIKTLGDCYMLCGGLPEPITYSTLRTVYLGSKMIRIVSALTALQPVALQLRVGIHTGDVVAGILGEERIIFDVWSTDVSIASLMEQSGKPSWVHVSQEAKNQLDGYCSLRVGPVVRFQERDLASYFFNDLEERGKAVLDFIVQQKDTASKASWMDGSSGDDRLSMGMGGGASSSSRRGSSFRKDSRVNSRRVSEADPNGGALQVGVNRNLVFGQATGQNTKEGYASKNPFVRHVQDITKELSQKLNSLWLTFSPADEKEYYLSVLSKYNGRLVVSIGCVMLVFLVAGIRSIVLGMPHAAIFSFSLLAIGLLLVYISYSKIYAQQYESSVRITGAKRLSKVTTNTLADNNMTVIDAANNPAAKTTNVQRLWNLHHQAALFVASIKFHHMTSFPLFLLMGAIASTCYIDLLQGSDLRYIKSTLTGDIYMYIMATLLFSRHHWIRLTGAVTILMLSFHILHAIFNWDTFYPSKVASLLFMSVLLLVIGTITRRVEYNVRMIYLLKVDLRRRKLEVDDVRIKTEKMLYRLLPKHVVDRLKINPDREISDYIVSAGIMFCAIHHFKDTDMRSISILNDIIGKFDQMLEKFDVEKIKTIGSSATYMAACGLHDHGAARMAGAKLFTTGFDESDVRKPLNLEADNPDSEEEQSHTDSGKIVQYEVCHDDRLKMSTYRKFLKYALALKDKMEEINGTYKSEYRVQIGIHIGPLVAGVIGKSKFAYDVWGDTVNVASRMETNAQPGQIQVSEKVYMLLKDDFEFVSSGVRSIKGKGQMNTFLLVGVKNGATLGLSSAHGGSSNGTAANSNTISVEEEGAVV